METPRKQKQDVHTADTPVAESDLEKVVSGTAEAFEMDPEEERRLLRKLDWNIYPTLFVVYTLAYLDRINISNAKIQGLTEELHLTGNKFNITLFVRLARAATRKRALTASRCSSSPTSSSRCPATC